MSSARRVTLCDRTLDHPGHICAFFDSREEEYDILSPYYDEGLQGGEEVITIVDADRPADHRRRLEAHGISVASAEDSGRLRILTADDTYTQGGRFEAQRMYELLQGALAAAHHRGHRVRTSGGMGWSAEGRAGTEELMDYESRVNVLVPLYDCTLLCVYDLHQLSGTMVMDILRTHPYVIHRRQVLENPYYVPPIELLKEALFTATAPHRADEQPLA